MLVGEVWIGSGQSNMELPVSKAMNGKLAISNSVNPNIRLFHVPPVCPAPSNDILNVSWKACGPEAVTNFSAAAYFFGLELNKELNVPVGLIQSYWGGTPIEIRCLSPVTRSLSPSPNLMNGAGLPASPFLSDRWSQEEVQLPSVDELLKMPKVKPLA